MNLPIVILTISMILSACFTLRARERGLDHQLYIFKPLTMIIILLIALFAGHFHFSTYSYWVVIGLLFCLAGDVFLMFPEKRFVHGLVCFLIGHVFYILAFVSGMGSRFSMGLLLPFLTYGLVVYCFLWSHLGRMKLPVLVYLATIVIMVWQAWERWYQIRHNAALVASIGATLFVLSDSLLAWNRYRKKFRYAQILILSTYFTAQWLIALSVNQ